MHRARIIAVFALVCACLPVADALGQSPAPPPSGDSVHTVTETLVGAVGGVAVDRLGYIYMADFGETVYRVTPDGRATVFATGLYGASGNTIDSGGNLLQSNFSGNYITRIDRHGQQTIVARGLAGPVGITVDPDDNLYVVNCRGNTVSKVGSAPDAGGERVVSELAASDLFNCPNGITRGADGNLYVVNFADGRMLRVDMDGEVTEFASIPGGGNGHLTVARGSFYVTAFQSQRVYRVSSSGEVTHFAGTGTIGEEDGAALDAAFSWPNGIAAGPLGDRLYINDFLNRTPPTVVVPPTPKTVLRVIKLASLSDRMTAALRSGGIDAMVKAHDAWKSAPATASTFTEIEINALGYGLMGAGQPAAAMRVFELNTIDYPNSWNAWDSLGEAHMNAGNTARAIEFYEKSLRINPGNTNALAMLEKLRDES